LTKYYLYDSIFLLEQSKMTEKLLTLPTSSVGAGHETRQVDAEHMHDRHSAVADAENIELGRGALQSEVEALEDSVAEAEITSMVNQYKWHHRIDDHAVDTSLATSLRREEVLPGYSTFIEPGKFKEYEAIHGEIAFTHRVYDSSDLLSIIGRGLLSTRERLMRGIGQLGGTPQRDLETGGAESVFVRAVTEKSLRDDDQVDEPFYAYETVLIIKPELADRTDWYAYEGDKFGDRSPKMMEKRLTPDELFTIMDKEGAFTGNEEMFQTGIDPGLIAGIAVGSEGYRQHALSTLRRANITEISGVPVEDFVQVVKSYGQVLDIAHGRAPRAVQLTQLGPKVHDPKSQSVEHTSIQKTYDDVPETI
jgi:hypothetical protein